MAPRLLNIPPLTRGLLLGLLLLTLLNAGLRYRNWAPNPSERIDSRTYYVPYLTLIPGQSIIYPWVFVTATLAEQNLFGLLITGATLFYGGRYLERAWSSREFSKFMLIIALAPNLMVLMAYFALFVLSGNVELAYVFPFSSSILGPTRLELSHYPTLQHPTTNIRQLLTAQ